ncbi:unnamed protein product [Brassicogethes aeneus]|uniref:C2H2-type domain-containing protein n=1 Tax=Brassicogethes aeneus TaxID=1431903 RepID=A0A9P0FJE7_BRAAE|nr:unnamed protein product [Brassicogethes aeneus]
MRHLENFQENLQSPGDYEIKNEYFEHMVDMKEEIPNLLLDDNFMKNDFHSDDESFMSANINIDFNNDSDSEDFESSIKNEVKRNKRKALVPQRAVQLENSQNSSESSQDKLDVALGLESFSGQQANLNLFLGKSGNMIDPMEEDILPEINEEDIFKDLQNEADGEKICDEIMDNVKEEWSAHWGIKCNMCEKVFQYKLAFDQHYKMTYNLSPIYTCTFCNKTSEKYSTFRSHCYRHITEGRFKCDECSKAFSLKSMLQVHILSKHAKSKPFVCEECGRTFVTKPGLKIHLKKHKTETKEDYPCVECGKILHTRGGLTSHMNVHRLGRRFMCDVCGKTFTQKVNMQQHVKQHTGDKPHVCNQCGKTFAEKSHLARHFSFHSKERPFKCKVCQKMYKTERCLKVHSLVHAAARPFVCDHCNKGFLSSTKLKQHYNIHTGERPYKCKYCERTFTNYPNWLKHTRRRHKVDHITGLGLEPPAAPPPSKVPKEEVLPLASPSTTEQVVPIKTLDQPAFPSSAVVVPMDDKEGLNYPTMDDFFGFQQQIDIASASNPMSLLVPYFPATMPSHQTIMQQNISTMLPLQFTDMLHAPFMQQTQPCD